jgi:type I site-specific restriction-modification system R (restriction) subunit
VVLTTIQKFFPENKGQKYPVLSDRRNIVVIADEAHRSQYDFIDGFAKHMRDALPNASFIGFTGTPIESGDRSTPAVFGDYIDVYDRQARFARRGLLPFGLGGAGGSIGRMRFHKASGSKVMLITRVS